MNWQDGFSFMTHFGLFITVSTILTSLTLPIVAKTAIFGLPNLPKTHVLELAKKYRFSSAPWTSLASNLYGFIITGRHILLLILDWSHF